MDLSHLEGDEVVPDRPRKPGGQWQTVTASPASAAKPASSAFHNR